MAEQSALATTSLDEDINSIVVKSDNQTDSVPTTGATDAPVAMTRSFYNALSPQQQEAFKQKAPQFLDSFIKDDNEIVAFGENALSEVNSVVQNIIDAQGKIAIPEVDDLLVNANRELDDFQARYKNQRSSFEKKRKGLMAWFGGAKRSLLDWKFEAQNTSRQFDEIDSKIIKKREELKTAFYQLKQLMEANFTSTNKMVGIMAALEVTHDLALERATELQEKLKEQAEGTPEWNEVNQSLERVADVANSIEQQHANYMTRLAIAWATNTQIRNIMRITGDTVRKLNAAHVTTIPTMKLVVSQIGQIGITKDGIAATVAIENAQNKAIDALVKASNEIPGLQRQAQTSTVSADTIKKMADSVVAQNQGVITALVDSRKDRVALEQAVLDAGNRIKASDKIRDDKLVEALLGEQQKNKEVTKAFEKEASEAYQGTTDLADGLV